MKAERECHIEEKGTFEDKSNQLEREWENLRSERKQIEAEKMR